MPLYLLGLLVVLGIALIVLLTHLLGFSKRYSFANADDARERWLREWPGDQVAEVVLSADAHRALVQTDAGPGEVFAMGADTAARRLTAGEASDWTQRNVGVKQ